MFFVSDESKAIEANYVTKNANYEMHITERTILLY